MNTDTLLKRRTEWLVAEFGKAQLVQAISGRYELRGGSLREYQEAKEWCSIFMPEVVIWRV